MKTTVSLYDFRDAFRQYDRANSFSYDGYRVLFEFLEEYEDSTGSEVELDVIGLCCEYSEGTPDEIARGFGNVKAFICFVHGQPLKMLGKRLNPYR